MRAMELERDSPCSPRSLRAWKRPDECLTRAYSTCASSKAEANIPRGGISQVPLKTARNCFRSRDEPFHAARGSGNRESARSPCSE